VHADGGGDRFALHPLAGFQTFPEVVGGITPTTSNYFGWHGAGEIRCPGGRSRYHNAGCFSSNYAPANTALTSTRNLFKYKGKTAVATATILKDNMRDAALAFHAPARRGFNSESPCCGSDIAHRIGLVVRVKECLRTRGQFE
jgi:hypothetical protein